MPFIMYNFYVRIKIQNKYDIGGKDMSLAEKIFYCFRDKEEFSLKEAYVHNADKTKETIRARIYENLGIKFERVAKGVYKTIG